MHMAAGGPMRNAYDRRLARPRVLIFEQSLLAVGLHAAEYHQKFCVHIFRDWLEIFSGGRSPKLEEIYFENPSR